MGKTEKPNLFCFQEFRLGFVIVDLIITEQLWRAATIADEEQRVKKKLSWWEGRACTGSRPKTLWLMDGSLYLKASSPTNLKSHRARTHFRYKGFLSSQVAIVIMKILKFQIMSKMTYEAVKHANWWKMKNSVSFIWWNSVNMRCWRRRYCHQTLLWCLGGSEGGRDVRR